MRKFSPDEMATLITLREDCELQWADIARALPGRNADTCRSVYSSYRRKRDGRRTSSRAAGSRDQSVIGILPPTSDWHNSLTAAICGDPLPGRSALDQRGIVS